MKHFFVGVNYKTSEIIEPWFQAIQMLCLEDAYCILADNFSTQQEKEKVESICELLGVVLLCRENDGYGAALNDALQYIVENHGDGEYVVAAGNLDLNFTKFRLDYDQSRPCVYVPRVLEGDRNRNPFKTRLNMKIEFLYNIAAKYNSLFFFYLAIAINRALSKLPSKIAAVHGCCFIVNKKFIRQSGTQIFNPDVFLYCEEMDFAYLAKSINAHYQNADIEILHEANVSTKFAFKNKYERFQNWRNSQNKLIARWK